MNYFPAASAFILGNPPSPPPTDFAVPPRVLFLCRVAVSHSTGRNTRHGSIKNGTYLQYS